MTKAKQMKKGKRKATMVVALPSSTNAGGEKGSGSMKTTVSPTMVTRGSVTGPRKETLSTPVRSNNKNKKKKLNVVS